MSASAKNKKLQIKKMNTKNFRNTSDTRPRLGRFIRLIPDDLTVQGRDQNSPLAVFSDLPDLLAGTRSY